MIIDFYGVPGCGKSTVSHILAELYRKNGKSVSEPTFELDHDNSICPRKIKKITITIIWTFLHPQKTQLIYRMLLNNKLSFGEMLSEMMGIIVKAYYIAKKKKNQYVIFDEGLTQAIVSLSKGEINSINEEIRSIETIIYDGEFVYRVYIKESIDTALERMNLRSTNDSRVEKEKSTHKRMDMMKRYQDRCDCVSLDNCILVFGNNQSAETIARIVESKLESGEIKCE